MAPRSNVALGPSWIEMLFKAAAIGVLTLFVGVQVLPIVGLVILDVVVPDASVGEEAGVAIVLGLVALACTLGAVVWSVRRDLAERRKARSRDRASGPASAAGRHS